MRATVLSAAKIPLSGTSALFLTICVYTFEFKGRSAISGAPSDEIT